MFSAYAVRPSVFGTLRTNVRLFPRFATFVLMSYLVVGLLIAGFVAYYTTMLNGLEVAAVLLLLDVIASVIAFRKITSNPDLFSRCQRAADALVNYRQADTTEESESEYNDEDYDEEPEEEFVEEESEEEGEEPNQTGQSENEQ